MARIRLISFLVAFFGALLLPLIGFSDDSTLDTWGNDYPFNNYYVPDATPTPSASTDATKPADKTPTPEPTPSSDYSSSYGDGYDDWLWPNDYSNTPPPAPTPSSKSKPKSDAPATEDRYSGYYQVGGQYFYYDQNSGKSLPVAANSI